MDEYVLDVLMHQSLSPDLSLVAGPGNSGSELNSQAAGRRQATVGVDRRAVHLDRVSGLH
jgi:hypothetical protein